MSLTTDLEMAYHIGFDDALAKRKPDASKVHMLGRGECHDAAGDGMDYFACSRCGGIDLSKEPTFCHWCGAEVVTDG